MPHVHLCLALHSSPPTHTRARQHHGSVQLEALRHGSIRHTLQAGFYYHGVSAEVVLRENVAFNGPRAGINLNDGFGGGHRIDGNLVFNMVRGPARGANT